MAKVARASISAVQSAAESQQLLPALQQLLATCSIASKTANPAECDAVSSVRCDAPTSLNSLADAASCSYAPQDQVTPGLQHNDGRHWHRWLSTHSTPRGAVCMLVADGNAGSPGKGTAAGPKQPSAKSTTSSSSSGSGAKAQADPLTLALDVLRANSYSSRLTPSKIVQQLDKHIVGQPVGALGLLALPRAHTAAPVTRMQPAGLQVAATCGRPSALAGQAQCSWCDA
jgi:hypothetical protein